MKHLLRMVTAAALIFAVLSVPAQTTHSVEKVRAQSAPAADNVLFLPMIYGPASPAGTYDCDEYEFGLIWTTEVITLSVSGASVYAYSPPYTAVVTGTWVYTPASQEIGFTNFRWLTATVQLPNRLWASKYLPQAGFDVALSCDKRVTMPNTLLFGVPDAASRLYHPGPLPY
jgi:hypothetical protein